MRAESLFASSIRFDRCTMLPSELS